MSKLDTTIGVSPEKIYGNDSNAFDNGWTIVPKLSTIKSETEQYINYAQPYFLRMKKWRSYIDGDINFVTRDNKSRLVKKLIKKSNEWRYPSLEEPFLSNTQLFELDGTTTFNKDVEEMNLIINHQFTKDLDRVDFINNYIRSTGDNGTSIIKVNWETQHMTERYQINALDFDENIHTIIKTKPTPEELASGTITVEEQKQVKNTVDIELCDINRVYFDPSCNGDLDKARAVVHEIHTTLSDLVKDGRFSNLSQLTLGDIGVDSIGDTSFTAETLISSISLEDTPRKTVIVREYWGDYDIDGDGIAEPVVIAWIGDTIIRMEENPYPLQEKPFVLTQYLPEDGCYGTNDVELLMDNQDVLSAIARGTIDTIGATSNGQTIITKGAFDIPNQDKFDKGEHCEMNQGFDVPSSVYTMKFTELPQSIEYFSRSIDKEAESLTGVVGFSSGITGNVLGSMLDIETDIPMIDGSWKKLGSIVDGDVIIGSDGKGTMVTKAHEIRPPKIAYDMEFSNNSIIKSGGEHLWTVKVFGTKHSLREWTTMEADEVFKHMEKGRRVTIPKMQELHTGKPTNNTISPYVLGFWLGDGNSHSARITTEDLEVLQYFKDDGYICSEVKDSSKCGKARMYDVTKVGSKIEFDSNGDFKSNDSLHTELRSMDLLAKYGGSKHIPEEYFTATYDEKMELIRGLMDSDGYAHSSSYVVFCQSDGILKDDMIRLIESLGLKASIRCKKVEDINRRRQSHSDRTDTKMITARKDAYEIGFTPWSTPFKLPRKTIKWKTPTTKTVRLKSMVVVDKVLMRCLTVDSEDRLYAVSDKYTLTHNTATAVRSATDAVTKRELSILRRFSSALAKVARKAIRLNIEYLTDEDIMKITGFEEVFMQRTQYQSLTFVNIQISTPELNASKAEQLAFMLQTIGTSMGEEVRMMILAKIARLNGIEDLAFQLDSYKAPEPSQFEIDMQQAELDYKKADIAYRQAQANKLNADAGVSSSKESEMDIKNSKEVSGVAQDEKLEMEQAKRSKNNPIEA